MADARRRLRQRGRAVARGARRADLRPDHRAERNVEHAQRLVASALLGTKVVDAVGDLRAHPTGDMGSLGMANVPKPTIQTAAGGNRANNPYIELVVRGATAKVSPILRRAADMAGGFIASAATRCARATSASTPRSAASRLRCALGEAIQRGGAARRRRRHRRDLRRPARARSSIRGNRRRRRPCVYTADAFDIGTITIADGAAKRACCT